MSDKKVEFLIKNYKEDACCDNCIYRDDKPELCELRLCIHAIDRIYERFKPREGREER